MQMRMPDRLEFSLHADEAASALRCPRMMLLTLVEKAVRHGVDPSEDGGRIDVQVRRLGDRCRVRVADTGVGFSDAAGGLGRGLSTLRERLKLSFAGDVRLELNACDPRGVCAEIDVPAETLHG